MDTQTVQGSQAPWQALLEAKDHAARTTGTLHMPSQIHLRDPAQVAHNGTSLCEGLQQDVTAAVPSHPQSDPGDLPFPESSHLPSFLLLRSQWPLTPDKESKAKAG